MHAVKLDWKKILEEEISLDPINWESAENIGKKMIQDMVSYLSHIREDVPWVKPTNETKEFLKAEWLDEGRALNDIYNDFQHAILPYRKGNIHPRHWSWVEGTGSLTASFADFLGSVMNSNLGIGDHAAMYVEQQVIDWCIKMLGMPASSSGILLSGGSMANITGLMVARNAIDPSIRLHGVQAWPKRLLIYSSVEGHSCHQKATEAMGLGASSLRLVPVNTQYEIDVHALQQMIEEDLAAGHQPFCVIGNVGTVNTGAIDDLESIERLCKQYNLWFHIDGAFGALTYLLPEFQALLEPMTRADSVAFDLHKWMYLPYEVGCVLIKDKNKHRDAFALQPSYLLSHERGLSAGPEPIGNFGMELSRGFKALKVWFCFQEYGRKKYEDLIRQNLAHCLYLADKIREEPQLELMAPVPMNIVCFRFNPSSSGSLDLNALNKEILMQLHEKGIATPSYTVLNGKYVIRVAHVNHRSTKRDFDILLDGVLTLGRTLVSS
jgi:glutamate/tyrosine decarboxylase-like PLP-dependent enzyme